MQHESIKKPRHHRWDSRKTMILVAASALILYYSIFFVFPIGYALVGSFFNWMPTKRVFSFIGFENYSKIFSQSTLGLAMKNTLLFTLIVTLFRTAFGLLLAVLINMRGKTKTLFRMIYFLPYITSTVDVSMVWKWLFEPSAGPLNYYLSQIGLPTQLFLKDSNQALFCVMLMTIWKETGYATVIFMAGLTNIPSTLYEAAEIDGANRIQSFSHITLPLLKSTIEFIVLTSFVTFSQTFTQIDLMTGGGPGKSTYTMVYYLYQEAFSSNRFGRASAIAFVLFAVILFFSLLQLRMRRNGGDL